jgi:CAAX prenyl protease-like protein
MTKRKHQRLSSNREENNGMNFVREPAGVEADASRPEHSERAASTAPGNKKGLAGHSDIVPYLAPMIAYVALGALESYLPSNDGQPSPVWYPLAYTARVVVVALVAWRYRATWSDFRPWPSAAATALAVLIGMIVWGLWVGLDSLYPALPFLSTRVAFDLSVMSRASRWAFVAVRMLGLVVIVPLVEELFWRSFLIRWLIDQEFERVAIGRITPVAGVVTSVSFALVHPEWLPALLTGALWVWLLAKTRSLGACLVSHATANLALGLYVIAAGDWKYW